MASAAPLITKRKFGINQMGLEIGQKCADLHIVYRTAYWYDRLGTVLGWGDLSADDFNRIASVLSDGELFIAARRIKRAQIGDLVQVDELLDASPFVIGRNQFFHVSRVKDVIQSPYIYMVVSHSQSSLLLRLRLAFLSAEGG
jgi:hypothetical protein